MWHHGYDRMDSSHCIISSRFMQMPRVASFYHVYHRIILACVDHVCLNSLILCVKLLLFITSDHMLAKTDFISNHFICTNHIVIDLFDSRLLMMQCCGDSFGPDRSTLTKLTNSYSSIWNGGVNSCQMDPSIHRMCRMRWRRRIYASKGLIRQGIPSVWSLPIHIMPTIET